MSARATPGNSPIPVVLIVEDNAAYLLQLQKIFRLQGMQVIQAPDGLSALHSAVQELPDLLVADVEMPMLSGLALCSLLKSRAPTAEIPIILLHEGREQKVPAWHVYARADHLLDKFADPALLAQTAWTAILERGYAGARARAGRAAGTAAATPAEDLIDQLVAQDVIRTEVGKLAPLVTAGNRHQLARAMFDVLGRVATYRAAGVFFLEPTYPTFFMHTLHTLPPDQLNGMLSTAVTPLRTLLRGPIRLELFSGDEQTPRELGRWTPQSAPPQASMPIHHHRLQRGDQTLGSIALIPAQPDRSQEAKLLATFADQFSLILTGLYQYEECLLLRRELEVARGASAAHQPMPRADVRTMVERLLRGEFGKPSTAQQRVLEAVLAMGDSSPEGKPETTSRGTYAAGREPTDLLRLIREVCASVQPATQQARLRFEARIPNAAPSVRLDRQGITAALTTLLQIAIARTPPGGKVTLWVIAEAGQIRIAVQDTGSGFDSVTEPDARSGEMRANGLATSRAMVEAHGGTIVAESSPGKGNLCMITIPLDTAGSAIRPGMQEGVA